MKRSVKNLTFPLLLLLTALLLSCSTKKNTKATRFWHSFTAHYNTYFNGHQAFIEAEKTKEGSHKDDYTEMLPVFLVGVEQSRTAGRGNYETAIKKCQKAITLHSIKRKPMMSAEKQRQPKAKQYLQRGEFNPFLRHAWLLMGESQFEKGDFLEAAATFSYITRLYKAEPTVAAEARQWLARCYAHVNWYYDAQEALDRLKNDSIHPRQRPRIERLADATRADLLLRQQRYEEALPFLQKAAKKAPTSYQKARLYYLLGQVYQQLGRPVEADKALARCIRKSPPFEMSFNARILRAELMAGKPSTNKKIISRLKRMARSENSKDHLDRVYYAMGNVYLSEGDTAHAIGAYETGREKSTAGGAQKGVLLLRLGQVYWDQRRFDLAQTCYTEAVGLLDKERKDYDEITRRSKVLDKLVPHTSSIHLQDSLQSLAQMSESDRNAAIDRVIEALKKKEKAEREASLDSAAQARAEENGGEDFNNNNNQPPPPNNHTTSTTKPGETVWYFYNPPVVMQGKQDFRKQWGQRKNEDNWRRSNRTVVVMDEAEGFDYAADDSLRAVEDSLTMAEEIPTDSVMPADPSDDPHNREYYLRDIPFTPEAKAASDEILKDALYNAGIIEKDDLEDFPLASETLGRLTTRYDDFNRMADAYYQLYLLYSRWGKADEAESAKTTLISRYPESEEARRLANPNYLLYATRGREIEDSLYTKAYEAYRTRHNDVVANLYLRSTEDFPSGLNRPKFMFVHTLSRLQSVESTTLIDELRDLLSKYPESDVSTMAGMIVKGLESGRTIGSGTFDLGSLWSRRIAAADSAEAGKDGLNRLTAERQTPFLFVFVYPIDSIKANDLLYEVARYNFTGNGAGGYDISFDHSMPGLSMLRVAGFPSYEHTLSYARGVYNDPVIRSYFKKGRILLISKDNLDLLGTRYSFDDYRTFYDEHFAEPPIDTSEHEKVIEQIEQHYEDEYTPEELERIRGRKAEDDTPDDDDGGEWY